MSMRDGCGSPAGGAISRTQLMALLWAGVMAPAAELLPGLLLPGAGKGAWLAVLLAAPAALAAGWILGRLSGRAGLAAAFAGLLGGAAGRCVTILYMVWGELLLALRLRMCAQRLLSSGDRDGTLWFFLLSVAGVLLWMGRGTLPAFARAAQWFLVALLLTAGVVLVLSLPQAKMERLLPLWWTDGGAVLRAALSAAGVLGWGLFVAFLIPHTPEEGRKGSWYWPAWCIGGCLLLALSQAVILGNLGSGVAGTLDNPFFALAKSVGVEGAFQRVESVITAVWTLADLTMGGVLLFAVRTMAEEAAPKKILRWVPWLAVAAGVGLAWALFSSVGTAERWSREVVPAGNLLLGLGVPAVLLAWKIVRGRDRGRGTSCA